MSYNNKRISNFLFRVFFILYFSFLPFLCQLQFNIIRNVLIISIFLFRCFSLRGSIRCIWILIENKKNVSVTLCLVQCREFFFYYPTIIYTHINHMLIKAKKKRILTELRMFICEQFFRNHIQLFYVKTLGFVHSINYILNNFPVSRLKY